MALFKIYNKNEYQQIAEIMAHCFNEPISSVIFFLKNKSKTSKCFTCVYQKNIIAVLHSLPYKMKLKKDYFKCSYVYGACTAPKYRKKGYMSKLIKLYETDSKINGKDFSVLIPDNKHLENYYYKLGYRNFFKIKKINLNKNQLLDICRLSKITQKNEDKNFNKNLYKNIEKLRLNIYNNIDHILYNEEDIKYAANLYKFFGGRLISIPEGYGICVPISKNTLEIKDFTCKNEFIPDLLRKIYLNFPNFQNFKIKISTNNTFFKENAETQFFGMIKPLSSKGAEALEKYSLKNNHYAYLGLALD